MRTNAVMWERDDCSGVNPLSPFQEWVKPSPHAASVRKQERERNRRYRKIHKEACDLGIVTVTITKLPYGPQGMERVLSYDITKHDIMYNSKRK